jgi:hypothetical protein
MKLFLKSFFLSSLIFGAIMVITSFLPLSQQVDISLALRMALIKGSFLGVVFGVIISCLLTPLHYCAFKMAVDRNFQPNTYEAKQKYCLETNTDANTLFSSANQAFIVLNDFVLKFSDKERMLIEGETKKTWKSFKENIRLEVEEVSTNKSRIIITSFPTGRFTVFDYGKNYENIKKLQGYIKDSLSINFERI